MSLNIQSSLFWMGGSAFLGQIITWSITIFIARILMPSDYGLVALTAVFTIFAQLVSEMGVGTAVIQADKVTEAEAETLYAYSLLLGIGMFFLGFFIGAPAMAKFYDEPQLLGLIRFTSLVFIFAAARSMPRNLLVRQVRFDVVAKVETLSRVATSLLVLGIVLCGGGVWALASQWLLIELLQFVGFTTYKPVLPFFRLKFPQIYPMLHFGIAIVLRNIIYQFYNLCDVAIIGKIASESFLGSYSFAKQLTNLPHEKILRIINQVLLPYLSRDKNDLAKLRTWTLNTIELQLLLLVPFYILLFFCAEEVIIILLGSKWGDAVFPLQILCIANIFRLAESYNTNILTARGRVRGQVYYMFAQFIFLSIGLITLSKYFSVNIALYVWVTFYPLIISLLTLYTLREIQISKSSLLQKVFRILISQAVLIGFLAYLSSIDFDLGMLGNLTLKVSSGAAVYSAVLLLIAHNQVKHSVALFIRRKY